MTVFNHGYSKYIFLPSGGLEYNPVCWKKNLKNNYIDLLQDQHASYTSFEHITQIIKEHVTLPVDIEDLYLLDFYYIWSVFSTIDIDKKSFSIKKFTCDKCGKENKIRIDYSKLKIKNFDIYKQKKQNYFEYNINIDNKNLNIKFELRRVKHNLFYIYRNMNKNNNFIKLFYYIVEQIKEIKYDDTIIGKNDYFGIFQNIKLLNIIEIFNLVLKENNKYGINSKLFFTCKNKDCKAKNSFELFNDFALCTFTFEELSRQDKIEYFKNKLELCQLNFITLEELSNIAYKDNEYLSNAINEMEILPRMGI